jgi:UDP-2-acetamido-3-amino-2,3-dideoxy-glucuronate N-acetyltransferase
MIHASADVQSKKIGINTSIWQFVIVLPNAAIGNNCNINSHVFIENEVQIGDNVTIKSGVQLWDGIIIEDNVFIGPNVTFTNDLIPRSKQYPASFAKTIIKEGASIGANATIIAGNEIGSYAMVGAGAVVTKNVGSNELWVGNPAKQIGFITNKGDVLDLELKSKKNNKKYCWNKGKLKSSND